MGMFSEQLQRIETNIDVAGAATTHGMKSLAGNMKTADAPVVARLRAAGATPIAHANMPTLNARGMRTYSELVALRPAASAG